MATFCDQFVTVVSGLGCLSIIAFVANLDSSKKDDEGGGGHSTTAENSTELLQQMCNFTNPLLESAKKFDQTLKEKDFLQQVAHRLTHRQEAIHAAISLTVIVIFILV